MTGGKTDQWFQPHLEQRFVTDTGNTIINEDFLSDSVKEIILNEDMNTILIIA